MKDYLRTALGVLILATPFFGLFIVIFAPIEMAEKAEAETWPSRRGIITSSYASEESGRRGSYWEAEICGTYRDNGEEFCIKRVRIGDFTWGSGKTEALEAAARYPVGREVEVYYAPDDPEDTILEAHSSWHDMIALFGFGLIGLLLPVVLWVCRPR